jgi:hypothetical protein
LRTRHSALGLQIFCEPGWVVKLASGEHQGLAGGHARGFPIMVMGRIRVALVSYCIGKVLERIGESFPSPTIDRAALRVTAFAVGLGLLVFFLVPADRTRLTRFAVEHVALFHIVDSTPQRLAFLAFFVTLAAGALAIRLIGPARLAPLSRTTWSRPIGFAALAAIALNVLAFGKQVLPTVWDATSLPTYPAYAACVAVLIWNRRLPWPLIPATTALVLLLACLPGATGLMDRVSAPDLPSLDLHLSALFSGGEMLNFGYRLFVDVPVGYGILTSLALGGAIRAGVQIDLRSIIHLVEFFQVVTFFLIILAGWAVTQGAERRGRLVAVFLLVIVAAPFLNLASNSVHAPNLSGYRFLMLPVAVLALVPIKRWPVIRVTALLGAVAVCALLYNLETGIAIVAGLGLAWLLRARRERRTDLAMATVSGLVAAMATLGVVILSHRGMLGTWPNLEIGRGVGLILNFGAGFGGLRPQLRITALVIFGHAGYLLVRALSRVLGRADSGPDEVSAGISAIIIAWIPYYANRTGDGGLWGYLVLYALLLAPAIASGWTRSGWLAFISLLLIVPVPLAFAGNSLDRLLAARAMRVEKRCAAGLSLPYEACLEQRERAAELHRLAVPGDVLWMTAYPFLTLRLTGLRPLVAPLDLYIAALTEADLKGVAVRIQAAKPMALVLDAAAPSDAGQAWGFSRSLLSRIATLAGYEPCPIVDLSYWEAWLPPRECYEASPAVVGLRSRVSGFHATIVRQLASGPFVRAVPLLPETQISQRFKPRFSLKAISVTLVTFGRVPSDYTVEWRVVSHSGNEAREIGTGKVAAAALKDWQNIELPLAGTCANGDEVEVSFTASAELQPSAPIGIPLFASGIYDAPPPASIDNIGVPDRTYVDLNLTYQK